MVAHIFFGVIKMVIMGAGQGMQDIFAVLILFCAYKRLDYCMLLFYMFSLISMIFYIIIALGLLAQKSMGDSSTSTSTTIVNPAKEVDSLSDVVTAEGGQRNMKIMIIAVLMIFYIVALVFSFKGYKEFKGLMEDNLGE